jgi:hypothetical protein
MRVERRIRDKMFKIVWKASQSSYPKRIVAEKAQDEGKNEVAF